MRPLDNSGWGFESNCFVCEPGNERGLGIAFSHDEPNACVVASFELGSEHSGAPSYAHGGIVLAILDEAMAWAAIAVAGRFAVTTETTTRFLRPVRIGRRYRVVGRIEQSLPHRITAAAVVSDDKERDCAVAQAVFAPLDAAQAADAVGGKIGEGDAGYLQPDT